MGDACNKFGTPVTGGNVSFYNQGPEGAVYPTPTIGMLGVLDTIENKMSLRFKHAGDFIYLIGKSREDIACSEYLHHLCGVSHSPAPYFDLEEEYAVQQTIAKLIERGTIRSAHDISEGGLFTCLLECSMGTEHGFSIDTDPSIRKDAFLFGEAQGRVVVSVNPYLNPLFEAEVTNVPYTLLGRVAPTSEICIDGLGWGYLSEWQQAYDTALERMITS
jgi:phosphoribosylformylglycinamidine synthase